MEVPLEVPCEDAVELAVELASACCAEATGALGGLGEGLENQLGEGLVELPETVALYEAFGAVARVALSEAFGAVARVSCGEPLLFTSVISRTFFSFSSFCICVLFVSW